MNQRVYSFDKKEAKIGDSEFTCTDYFQYYTTGLEDIIDHNMLYVTERRNNERYEVLSHNLFNDADLSDMLLGLNNDVYLWDMPSGNDEFEHLVDVTYDYIQKVNKTKFPSEDIEQWKEIARQRVQDDDDAVRVVIIPKVSQVQKISRYFKDYFKTRLVT